MSGVACGVARILYLWEPQDSQPLRAEERPGSGTPNLAENNVRKVQNDVTFPYFFFLFLFLGLQMSPYLCLGDVVVPVGVGPAAMVQARVHLRFPI